jgi:acyl-CoA hydrolase
MEAKKPLYMNVEQAVDRIMELYGKDIRIGMPLGLGKPVTLINALYQRAKKDPTIKLSIMTSLSLEKPAWSSDLERRFLEPVVEKHFAGVRDIDYMLDLRAGKLPENVSITETYCKAGAYRHDPKMQQNYMSSNYTHTVRDADSLGNMIYAQTLAIEKNGNGVRYSGACNADVLMETMALYKNNAKRGIKNLAIGVVNPNLPFMHGDAVIPAEKWDILIDDPSCYEPLFGTPRQPVAPADFMIGLNVSTLIKDGGTLQIGIGALGDAIAYSLGLRNNKNDVYKKVIESSGIQTRYGELIKAVGGLEAFKEGLYGSTEMLVDGFVQLYKSGVIKRKVYHQVGVQRLINEGKLKDKIPANILQQMLDQETIHPYLTEKDFIALQKVGVFKEAATYANGQITCNGKSYSALLADKGNLAAISENCLGSQLKNGVVLTGAFFIGPMDFYETLKTMPLEEQLLFEMTGVNVANQLYGDETLRRLQRKDGRFCNTGMKATLLGHISSDMLEDGTVVSGVGGQYNFVAMGHALHDARVIMMIKCTRQEKGNAYSNILYNYGNVTIPRHLRDIVVTEYGIADIRGKKDQDVIKAMLNVADSRFQEELLAEAKKYKKIPEDYQIPEQYRNNTPERLTATLKEFKAQGLFPDFPFGTIFTGEELFIAFAMKALKNKAAGPDAAKFPEIMKNLPSEVPAGLKPMFDRMGLTTAKTAEEIQSQKMLMLAFKVAGFF